MTQILPLLEVLPRDLSAYRKGNIGVDYVHRFDSGQPGPHVLINALTHGNELCGMTAATHLLDNGVRPLCGTLTVSFANVAAYESFDPARPFDSRQLVHNFNRIWSSEWLDGPEGSPELSRARALRPVVAAADHVLDIHSTSEPVVPFWVYQRRGSNSRVACALRQPVVHLVLSEGLGTGTPLMQYGHHGHTDGAGTSMVVECGQHFLRSSSEVAIAVTLDFLAHFGLIVAPDTQTDLANGQVARRRYELLKTFTIQTPEFRFVRPLVGFEVFRDGELIATDGDAEIRALCDNCTVFMPARRPIVGVEAVFLTRPLD